GDPKRTSGHADCDRHRHPARAQVLRKRSVDLRTGLGIELRVLQVGDNTDDRSRPANPYAMADRVVRTEDAPGHRLVDEDVVRRVGAGNPAALYKPHAYGGEVSR